MSIIKPQPQQVKFLSTPADIAIYGGAAGAGKSFSLMLETLRHYNHPGFGAVIFRRTYPQIVSEGGLWDKSFELYPLVGGKPNKSDLNWTFPSGVKVSLRHLQHEKNKLDWQGSEICLIGWDELTHFSESMFFYLLSRNRSLCGIKPYVRSTTNPDATSWVRKFIDWYLDDEGFPNPLKSGVIRYFIRNDDGSLSWSDNPNELSGKMIEIEDEDGEIITISQEPKSFTFIPATIFDNTQLLRSNPGYLQSLKSLPPTEKARLLGGNWNIVESAGKLFNREWFSRITNRNLEKLSGGVMVRFWDLAATERKIGKGSRQPDYTASCLMYMNNAKFYILDVTAVQLGPADIDEMIISLAKKDKSLATSLDARYLVRWELEGGASGIRDSTRMVAMLSGFDASGVRPQGDAIVRSKPLISQSAIGKVLILDAEWNEQLLSHLHNQPGLPNDDIMVACAGAFNSLHSQGVQLVTDIWTPHKNRGKLWNDQR